MIDAFDKLAPADADYRHNAEGSDDMVPTPVPCNFYRWTISFVFGLA
jgi:hypothetical protein